MLSRVFPRDCYNIEQWLFQPAPSLAPSAAPRVRVDD
jgi:hypothetical protein